MTLAFTKKTRTEKNIKSDINKIKAYINQVKNDDIYTESDRNRLIPIYKQQLQELQEELKKFE